MNAEQVVVVVEEENPRDGSSLVRMLIAGLVMIILSMIVVLAIV